jgi:hypothetical protein
MERGALRIDFRGQRYNIRVPPPDIHVPSLETQAGSSKQHRYASEAIGWLLIALVLLVLGLVRYWPSIQWSLR